MGFNSAFKGLKSPEYWVHVRWNDIENAEVLHSLILEGLQVKNGM